MTIAEYIADRLYDAGVRYVFGIPGGPSIPYLEAFRKRGIDFILTSHEASAGVMAAVTARLTGNPGVCHATFGPGATNISTGVGGALLDRSPVLVLTSEVEDLMANRTCQMNIDHQRLFAPLTKATFRLNPGNIDRVLNEALRICMTEFPGPVHIGLPSDIADSEAIPDTISDNINAPGPLAEFRNDIIRISALLQESRRPLAAVGLTAKRLGIKSQLISFLDRCGIPCVITPMAKGIIPHDHPSYAGVLFHALSDYLRDIIADRDLILGIGYDPVEYNYETWIPNVPLLHFNTVETDLPAGQNIHQYAGPPEEWFDLLGNLNPGIKVPDNFITAALRDEMAAVFSGFSNDFGPVGALKIIREEIPASSLVTADVGSHLHVAGQYWDTYNDGEFIITNGWSGMGFGIPAALAAQISNPGARVVCITGDGGFAMTAGEIVTARRYKLPVIIVVFSDGELNLIRLKQSWKDVPGNGTTLYHGDLFGADVFFGVKVFQADTNDSMREVVRRALSLREPVIINAIINPEDYKWLITGK